MEPLMTAPTKHAPNDLTRGQVIAYAATGMKQELIARTLGLSLRTLRKNYLKELELSQAERVARVATNLYQIAMSPKRGMPQVISSLFLLKTQGRWKEVQGVEHTGENGGPLPGSRPQVVIQLPPNGREVLAEVARQP